MAPRLPAKYRSSTVSPRRGQANFAASSLTPVSVCPPTPSGFVAGFVLTRPVLSLGAQSYARAIGGAEQSRKPFLESPADFFYPRAELDEARPSRSRPS